MSKEAVKELTDAVKDQNLGGGEGEEQKYDRWNLRPESAVDYGLFGTKDQYNRTSNGGYYITTAINYTNGPAHMGHAYEAATADALARYARVRGGRDGGAQFVTGTDEHGEKVAKMAADGNSKPIDLCNKVKSLLRHISCFYWSPQAQYMLKYIKRVRKSALVIRWIYMTYLTFISFLSFDICSLCTAVCDWVPMPQSAHLDLK